MLQLWFAIHTLLWPVGVQVGDSYLSLNVILLTPMGVFWLLRRWKITRVTGVSAVIFLCVILLSFIAAKFGPCEDKFSKAIITTPLLTLLLIIGLEIGGRAKPQDWQKLRETAFGVIMIAISFILIEMLAPSLFSPEKAPYHEAFKYSGIYFEPSHVAISLFPCIAILLSSKEKSYNQKGLCALLLLIAISLSSTLIMLTLGYIAYRLIILGQVKKGLISLIVIGLLVALAFTLNYELLVEPTVSRIVGITSMLDADGDSAKKVNLSSMVYIKGWQDALANLERTNGIGLGFNMMGCSPLPDVSIRNILSVPGRTDLNNEDGSFLLSKIASEFGVTGVVLFILVIVYWFRYQSNSAAWSVGSYGDVSLIHSSIMFSFVATSLLRSTGYFQGGFLLWVAAVAGSARWYKVNGSKIMRKSNVKGAMS
jgi:hypothetical protein